MALTKRAQTWLSTLDRETPVATTLVEQWIRDVGGTPHRAWLDFHERFAGYVEELAPGELAIWGLARAKDAEPPSMWRKPETVFVVLPSAGDERISCADAHPVHEYELRANGTFMGAGGPCPTFDMKVERQALSHAFSQAGTPRQTLVTKSGDLPEHQKLLQDMAPFLVPEASTPRAQYFLAPRRFVIFNPPFKQIVMYELEP
jgi:hypothetical protein